MFMNTFGAVLRSESRKQQGRWALRSRLLHELLTNLLNSALLERPPERLEIASMCIRSISTFSTVTLPNKGLQATALRAAPEPPRWADRTLLPDHRSCSPADRQPYGANGYLIASAILH